MIMKVLILKEKIKELYGRYDKYLIPLFRFVLGFITIMLINANIGFMAKLDSPLIAFLIGVICAFLPSGGVVAFGALVMFGHIISSSVELGAIVFVVFIVLLCAYYRFSPHEGYMVALTVVLFGLKMPYMVPVIAGLTLSLFSFIPSVIGIFVYYLMKFASQYDKTLDEMTTTNIMDNVRYILDGLFNNKAMIVYMLVFAVVIVLINTIKKFSIDYAWAIAAGVGVLVNVVMMIICNAALDAGIGTGGIVLGNILALIIAAILYVLVFSGDYSRTERVQFEDDDYYYYVKAVPKFSVVAADVKVKKINARKAKQATAYGARREEKEEYDEYQESYDEYDEYEYDEEKEQYEYEEDTENYEDESEVAELIKEDDVEVMDI